MAEASSFGAFRTSRRRASRRILFGFLALILVALYGIIGYITLGWDPFDALYMVVITLSTVGFTEVHAELTRTERVHTMLVIAFGTFALAYTVAGVVQLVFEGELQGILGRRRLERQISELRGHTIVAGFGRMGALVCSELHAAKVPFVLVEKNGDRVPEIEESGWLYLVGDATEEKVLQDAGLAHARALVTAIPSDAVNVFITLTARQLAPQVEIVARAEYPSTQKKLRQAGANHVVLPAAIGAHRIVSILTNPSAVEFTELVTHRSHLEIEMDEVVVQSPGSLAGVTLRDADIGRRTGVMVIAVKRADGRVEFPPTGDVPFAAGDSIVLLGRRATLDQFRKEYQH